MRSQQEIEEMLTIARFFDNKQAVKALEWVLSYDGGSADGLPKVQQPDTE